MRRPADKPVDMRSPVLGRVTEQKTLPSVASVHARPSQRNKFISNLPLDSAPSFSRPQCSALWVKSALFESETIEAHRRLLEISWDQF